MVTKQKKVSHNVPVTPSCIIQGSFLTTSYHFNNKIKEVSSVLNKALNKSSHYFSKLFFFVFSVDGQGFPYEILLFFLAQKKYIYICIYIRPHQTPLFFKIRSAQGRNVLYHKKLLSVKFYENWCIFNGGTQLLKFYQFGYNFQHH